MLVTAYDSGQKSCSWKYRHGLPVHACGPHAGRIKRVGITSDGTRARKGVISADISRYPYGTRMYVPGYGWGEVHDTGSAVKGDRIDVFFESRREALQWGKKYLTVKIIFPASAAADQD